jgi:presenilin-like A22 family membrane protease
MGEPVPTDHVKRVERELAKESSLLNVMIEQAPGMLGMAVMFVVTIAIGVWLRPFFDAAGLHAFGEAGTTQARYIILELGMIFVFTALILWLAKNHKELFIKYGLMGVLFLALCYTTVPGAHLLIIDMDDQVPFVFESNELSEEHLVTTVDDGWIAEISNWDNHPENNHNINWSNYLDYNHTIELNMYSGASNEPLWSAELDAWPGDPTSVITENLMGYTVTNGAYIWTLDKDDGEVISKYHCFDGLPNTVANDEGDVYTENYTLLVDGGCSAAFEVIEEPEGDIGQAMGALYIVTQESSLVRKNTFHGTNITAEQASWALPQLDLDGGALMLKQIDTNHILMASERGSIVVTLEKFGDSFTGSNSSRDELSAADVPWSSFSGDYDNFTATTFGQSPFDGGDSNLLVIGTESGEIMAYNWEEAHESPPTNATMSEENALKVGSFYEGPITAIDLNDLDDNGQKDLWIAAGDGIHGLFFESMIEYVTIDKDTANSTMIIVENSTVQLVSNNKGYFTENANGSLEYTETTISIESGEFTSDMYNNIGIEWSWLAFGIGLGLAIILMVLLFIRPEWYVVNTVGVLVGAGVIVMLGVTFVPTLIMIFMILAAIYDAWAVYRSKHMLDLADTMIGLKLPILLVAPQERGYSMLEEQGSVRPETASAQENVPVQTTQPKKRKKSKEAMFMGLGDVIFPGMLVVSAVQWVATGGLEVGIATVIGGLLGYLALMMFVASGRPQAGLPLLNGGAILGYIVGGILFAAGTAFSFGISL